MDIRGYRTRGETDPTKTLRRLGLPRDLTGTSVLDVGAWDGFFAFEAARRGAARVVATDSYSWEGDGWGTRDGFEAARRLLGLDVDAVGIEPHDLSPDAVGGTFDVVLFLGVLYHLQDPGAALKALRSVTRGTLWIETLSFMGGIGPTVALFPNDFDGDHSCWCAPNESYLRLLLSEAGFVDVATVFRRTRAPRLAKIPLRGGSGRGLERYYFDRLVMTAS